MKKVIALVVLLPAILLSSLALAQIQVKPTADGELPDAIIGKGTKLGKAVNYFPGDPKATGYLAVPEGGEAKGAVILIHEFYGLVDRIRETADAMAREGYVALAADLYSGRVASNAQEGFALVGEVSADQQKLIDNLDAAAKFLRARDDVNGKIATIGWCFGGGVALSYAIGGENHEGTAIFYGSLLDDPEQMKHVHHEVYGTFAANDMMIPPDKASNISASVESFRKALRAAGVENDIHIYDDVGHGFWLWADQPEQGGADRKPAALDAWKRLKAYLERTIAE